MYLSMGLLAAGLVLLVLGGNWIVSGAASAAMRFGMSRFIASVVIVGFGTSVPEMLVAIDATLKNEPGLALGNIVGSNIANILLVLGIPAMFLAIRIRGAGLIRSVVLTGIATIAWLAITPYFGLTPAIGTAFLILLVGYVLGNMIWPSHADKNELISDDLPSEPHGWVTTVALICLGIVSLPLGAHLAIQGSLEIADILNVNSALVGLTLMAIGTSLPEMAAALSASFRRENDMILGNVAGSNLFNILGAGGIISLLPLFTNVDHIDVPDLFLRFDHWVLGGSFALFALYVFTRRPIGWVSGLLFVAIYAAYIFGLHHFYILGLGWSDLWS